MLTPVFSLRAPDMNDASHSERLHARTANRRYLVSHLMPDRQAPPPVILRSYGSTQAAPREGAGVNALRKH